MKVRYLGNGPGQGHAIVISGVTFVRGNVYSLPKAVAQAVLAKGGFVEVKKINPHEEDK